MWKNIANSESTVTSDSSPKKGQHSLQRRLEREKFVRKREFEAKGVKRIRIKRTRSIIFHFGYIIFFSLSLRAQEGVTILFFITFFHSFPFTFFVWSWDYWRGVWGAINTLTKVNKAKRRWKKYEEITTTLCARTMSVLIAAYLVRIPTCNRWIDCRLNVPHAYGVPATVGIVNSEGDPVFGVGISQWGTTNHFARMFSGKISISIFIQFKCVLNMLKRQNHGQKKDIRLEFISFSHAEFGNLKRIIALFAYARSKIEFRVVGFEFSNRSNSFGQTTAIIRLRTVATIHLEYMRLWALINFSLLRCSLSPKKVLRTLAFCDNVLTHFTFAPDIRRCTAHWQLLPTCRSSSAREQNKMRKEKCE